ncbi:MAG: TetR/AcrR family transcriptional regulator, partial [Stackebrandtia sp.]
MHMTDADARRRAIIHAVWQVIAENGMGALSMRNVAAAAGVSVGRIQYWFPSKDELLTASVEAMLSNAAQLHDAATEGADDREVLWHLIWQPVTRAEAARAGVSVFY